MGQSCPYVQSKGALVGLTRAWAREFGGYGITVNAISPGRFPDGCRKDPSGSGRLYAFRARPPGGKTPWSPADIAAALTFLISDSASFITGQTLNVDGGWVMH